MKKSFNLFVLLLAMLLRCGSALLVVRDVASYEKLAATDADRRLVDLQQFIPGITLDIRYATPDNFMKKPLYPVARAYLRRPAAEALRNAQRELASESLGLKVWDAYRPYRVTVEMWEAIRDPDYVADPAEGSRHNRGAAVDVTVIDLRTGAELAMPTAYDDFSRRAAHDFSELSGEAIANRAKLREVMIRNGFDSRYRSRRVAGRRPADQPARRRRSYALGAPASGRLVRRRLAGGPFGLLPAENH